MLKCPCGFSVYEGCDKHFPETTQGVRNLNLIGHPRLNPREQQEQQERERANRAAGPTECPRCGSTIPRGCVCDRE